MLDRAKLNAALDYHVEHATDTDPRREIIDDLLLLIAGDANPATTLDQMAAAALRVAPHLLFLDERED